MNTLETHLRHFEQAFWYLPKIDKVTPSGGHLDLSIWPKINRLPLLSDIKDCAKFEYNHRQQSGLKNVRKLNGLCPKFVFKLLGPLDLK